MMLIILLFFCQFVFSDAFFSVDNELFVQQDHYSFQIKSLLSSAHKRDRNDHYCTILKIFSNDDIQLFLYTSYLGVFESYCSSYRCVKGFLPSFQIKFFCDRYLFDFHQFLFMAPKLFFIKEKGIFLCSDVRLLFKKKIFFKSGDLKIIFKKGQENIYSCFPGLVSGVFDEGVFYVKDGGVIQIGSYSLVFRLGRFLLNSNYQDMYGEIEDVLLVDDKKKFIRVQKITFSSLRDMKRLLQKMFLST